MIFKYGGLVSSEIIEEENEDMVTQERYTLYHCHIKNKSGGQFEIYAKNVEDLKKKFIKDAKDHLLWCKKYNINPFIKKGK